MVTTSVQHRSPVFPVPILVIVGMIIGGLIASTWTVARLSHQPTAAATGSVGGADEAIWTTQGWNVPDGADWRSSVVRVTTDRCGHELRGSGVVVDGAVLTNRHVVDGASSVRFTTFDGTVLMATTIAVGTDVDLARVEVENLPPGLNLAGTRPVVSDRPLTMAGFPAGHDLSSRPVMFAGVQRGFGFPDPARPLRLDVEVVPGESGSAVVDADGRLAGLLYARSDDAGAGLVIGSDELVTATRLLTPQPFEGC